MPEAKAVIEKKAKAFATAMNKAVKAKRDKKVAELNKTDPKKGGDAKVIKIDFRYSKNPISGKRSPEQQAGEVARGVSWTCSSSHMLDKARHVAMYSTEPGKSRKYVKKPSDPFGTEEKNFMTYSEFKAAWAAAMAAQGLRNYAGGKSFAAKDAYHLELPDSRALRTDSRVVACMAEYARLTRMEYKGPNKKFEGSSWKGPLKPHIEKYEKLAEDRRKAELKKYRFDGVSRGGETLVKGAKKSAKAFGKQWPEIVPPSVIDYGGEKAKKVSASGIWIGETMGRKLWELLPFTDDSGFDLKIVAGVNYQHLTYDDIPQSGIRNLVPYMTLVYKAKESLDVVVDVSVAGEVKLGKGAMVPSGKVMFDYVVAAKPNTLKGSIVFQINGDKVKASVK